MSFVLEVAQLGTTVVDKNKSKNLSEKEATSIPRLLV